jgi:acyl carrier protein
MNIEEDLRRYLGGDLLLGARAATLGNDDSLFDLLDSMQLLRVVGHLEKNYRIEVEDHELMPDNLKSVAALAGLVRRKRGLTGSPA